MRRRGVALLITLVFIAAMMALAAVFFGLSKRAFERVADREATLQTGTLLFELKNEVLGELINYAKTQAENGCAAASDKEGCKRDTMAAVFETFYGLPLTLQTGPSTTVLSCQPAQTKIDINTLKVPADTNASAAVHFRRTLVERFLQERYRLYATWQLLELMDFVFDESGTKYGYLKNDERLNIASDRFEKGRIGTARQLRAIVEDYVLLSHDQDALKVPWEDLFVYESLRTQIDFNHLDATGCELIFTGVPGACDRVGESPLEADIAALSSEANATIAHFNIAFGYNPVLDCRVNHRRGENSYRFDFGYDADSNRLFNFAMGF